MKESFDGNLFIPLFKKPVKIPYKKAYSSTFEDMQKRIPDLKKAHALIGYKPTYALDNIIRSMM